MDWKDLKYIITRARKNNIVKNEFSVVRDLNNKNNLAMGEPLKTRPLTMYDVKASDFKPYADRIFFIPAAESPKEEDKNYEALAGAISFVFEKTNAKTCLNKIQLLTQMYHETQMFGTFYEGEDSASKSKEDDWRGRGLIMLTHDYNYNDFYKAKFKTKEDPDKAELLKFAKTISTDLSMAAESAVWYLTQRAKIEKFFNDDNVTRVSASINAPNTTDYTNVKGLAERQWIFDIFKTVLNYENCK